jgi:hypothetical protein
LVRQIGLRDVIPSLSAPQRALSECSLDRTIFLEGPAGAGKSTAAAARLRHLIHSGVPADTILVMLPQRTLSAPYDEALRSPDIAAGGQPAVLTLGGLAQRMVELFWPVVAGPACFPHPDQPPTFLTLETAQYYMARIVRPLLDKGYFETVTIERGRIYSQILDNLNKAAVVGFPHTEIAERLKRAWVGEKSQLHVYDEAQDCANRFREYCLAHNLLDFSLQYEVFIRHLWPLPQCREYLLSHYAHLIVDNLEEDTAVAHDVLREWLPVCQSALLVYDWDGGYRRFLGADPGGGHTLIDLCREKVVFDVSFVTSPEVRGLARGLGRALSQPSVAAMSFDAGTVSASEAARGAPVVTATVLDEALAYEHHRYFTQMIEWTANEIEALVYRAGIPAGRIVALAPFMNDALRFLLTANLEARGIKTRSQRPSRSLREEPAARCLLALADLAHPAWGRCPPASDVAQAVTQAIGGLDAVRAQVLVNGLYRARAGAFPLYPFERLKVTDQERVTYVLGGRYERLRGWLAEYAAGEPCALDCFWSRLFGEVLAQPGFGFYHNFDAGEVAANLIESARKFRWAVDGAAVHSAAVRSGAVRSGAAYDAIPEDGGAPTAQEYVQMVYDGVVAAQYVAAWARQPEDAVLLAPAHTFLMANRPVDVQFWLDVGSPAWWERLNQPLTHPYVLSRSWPGGALWADPQEYTARQDALYALVMGLVARCRRKIYLGLSELGEQGVEQQGPLLRAIQQVLRRAT